MNGNRRHHVCSSVIAETMLEKRKIMNSVLFHILSFILQKIRATIVAKCACLYFTWWRKRGQMNFSSIYIEIETIMTNKYDGGLHVWVELRAVARNLRQYRRRRHCAQLCSAADRRSPGT